MSNIISKSHICPYRTDAHSNLAFVEYYNGHWCYGCNKGNIKSDEYYIFKPNPIDIQETRVNLGSEKLLEFNHFPQHILKWLYEHYAFEPLIRKYHIKYCAPTDEIEECLYFPITINNVIVAYQKRFFPSKRFYSKNIKNYIFDTQTNVLSEVVLVEDFISAIRVGEYTNCIWLQGTNITNEVLNYIMHTYSHIKVWLDGDEAGRKASKQIKNKIEKRMLEESINRAFSIQECRTVEEIHTDKDPKCYSNSEIKSILEGC